MKPKPIVIPPQKGARPVLTSRLHPALAEGLDGGRFVTLFARNSGSGGEGPRQACVLDACQAVDELAGFGLDVRHLMRSQDEMLAWLSAAPPLVSHDAKSGNRFSNRFVEIWLTPQVVLNISIGTGSQISDDTLRQPFMEYVADRVSAHLPILLFGKRLDRIGRRKWGFGPALEAMKTNPPSFIGDEEGIHRLDEASELRTFIAGDQAEKFAEKIPKQTRRGMLSRTGNSMSDGYVAYSIPAPPPPGLCRLRMAGSGVGSHGETRAYFEAPQWLPDPATVALGYPQVIDPGTGLVVDQVANVRWALAKLADPNWTYEQIGQALVNRRFSHTRTREIGGLDAVAAPSIRKPSKRPYDRPYAAILDPILNNLAFYETGVLHRTLGVAGIDDVTITDLLPPDGEPWATSDTFAAIRSRRRNRQARPRKSPLVLSRTRVTVNGRAALLSAIPEQRQEPSYGFLDAETRVAIAVGTTVPHTAFAELIAEALDTAVNEGRRLPPLVANEDDSPRLEQARHDLGTLERTKNELLERQERIFERMAAPNVDGPLQARLTKEYNEIARDALPEINRNIDAARSAIDLLESDLTGRVGATPDQLDKLIRALAKPESSDLSHAIRSLIHSLSINFERVKPHKHFPGYMAHMEVGLALRDPDDRVVIVKHGATVPLSGAKTYLKGLDERRVLLREGIPTSEHAARITNAKSLPLADVATGLGLTDAQRPVIRIEDPRLLRVAFAVVEASQTPVTDDAHEIDRITALLNEPRALVDRCWQLYGPHGIKQGRWRRTRRPADPTERFCAQCQELMLWPLIDEIAGGVCPQCRLDEAGLPWPHLYDQWLTSEPLHTAASAPKGAHPRNRRTQTRAPRVDADA